MAREPDDSMASRLPVTGQGGEGATGWPVASVTERSVGEAPQALLSWAVADGRGESPGWCDTCSGLCGSVAAAQRGVTSRMRGTGFETALRNSA